MNPYVFVNSIFHPDMIMIELNYLLKYFFKILNEEREKTLILLTENLFLLSMSLVDFFFTVLVRKIDRSDKVHFPLVPLN